MTSSLSFFILGVVLQSECVIGESYRSARLESTPVDLFEVLYIDNGVVLTEAKKWFITCMVV